MDKICWTKEKCLVEAKKYFSRTEWFKNSKSSYYSAWRNKWLEECCSHMGAKYNKLYYKRKWTKEKCLKIVSKCSTKEQFYSKYSQVHHAACSNGWLEELYAYVGIESNKWTIEKCIAIAKQFNTITDWKKTHQASYVAASRYSWLKKCTKHMKVYKEKNKITFKMCFNEAKTFSTYIEWKEKGKYFETASKKRYLKKCTSHMTHFLRNRKWNTEKCLSSALKFKTKADWMKNDRSAYQAAVRDKILNICCANFM